MYIHGFIDGALIVIVLEVVALVITAVVYAKRRVNSSKSDGLRQCLQSVSRIALEH